MGRKSSVEKLPGAILKQLRDRIVESAFGDFVAHEAWLDGLGYKITKSSIHRYAMTMRKIGDGSDTAQVNTEGADHRMRCMEVAAIVAPRPDLIATASSFYFWVSTGRQA